MSSKQSLALLIFLSSMLSTSVTAIPSLHVTEKFVVVSVNGQSFSSGLFSNEARVPLKKGTNKIALRYKELFEESLGDDHEVVTSNIFVVRLSIQKEQIYTLQYLRPHDASAARRYAREPKISIIDSLGENIRVENIYLASQSTGFVNQATRINMPAQPMINITSPQKAASKNSNIPNSSTEQTMAGQMLMFWWNKATPEQKQSFLDEIKAVQE